MGKILNCQFSYLSRYKAIRILYSSCIITKLCFSRTLSLLNTQISYMLVIISSYYLFNICRICSDLPFVFRNTHYLYFLFFPLLILVQVFITFVSLSKTQFLVVLLLFSLFSISVIPAFYYLFFSTFEGFNLF